MTSPNSCTPRRASVGAEVTSPWFYLQLGLILAGAGIAFARRRRRSLADRHDVARDGLAGTAAAVHARAGRQRADGGVRGTDDAGARGHADVDLAEPQLSARCRRQACLRMADHPPRYIGHPQHVYRSAGVAVGVAGGGVEHSRPARAGHRGARLGLDRARRTAADAAAADQARRAAGRGAVAVQYRQQFRGKPDHAIQRPDAVDPGAAGQDDPAGADDLRGRRR